MAIGHPWPGEPVGGLGRSVRDLSSMPHELEGGRSRLRKMVMERGRHVRAQGHPPGFLLQTASPEVVLSLGGKSHYTCFLQGLLTFVCSGVAGPVARRQAGPPSPRVTDGGATPETAKNSQVAASAPVIFAIFFLT